MLTAKAYQDRKWGFFPALRQVLEDKKIPSEYYGLTSVSDNMFESMNRLLEISVLVIEYEKHIKEIAQSVGREEMSRDLLRLGKLLEQTSDFFKRKVEEVHAVCYTL